MTDNSHTMLMLSMLALIIAIALAASVLTIVLVSQADAQPGRVPSPKACSIDRINGADQNNPSCIGSGPRS